MGPDRADRTRCPGDRPDRGQHWEEHSAISDRTSEEAAAIATLYRQSLLFPEAVRETLQDGLVEYTAFIVDQAWPAQANGEIPEGGTSLITDIESPLGSYEPTSAGMAAVHTQALDTFRDMVELRRLRLDAVGGRLSTAMRVFVLVEAAMSLTSSYLFVAGDPRVHAILVRLLATIIDMVVILIAAYDGPFVGDLAISADSYRLVLDAARASAPTQ